MRANASLALDAGKPIPIQPAFNPWIVNVLRAVSCSISPRLGLISLCLALSASPLAAQQSAQDFQLQPAPTPSATPQVEGPIDDSGVVPVGPRVLTPTPTPAPTPTPTPAPAPAPSAPSSQPTQPGTAPSREVVQPVPSSQGSLREAASPATRRTAQPLPTSRRENERMVESESSVASSDDIAPSSEADEGQSESETLALPSADAVSPVPAEPVLPTGDSEASTSLPDSWPWWLAGLAAAILALFFGWMFRRRKEGQVANAGLAEAPAPKGPGHSTPEEAIEVETATPIAATNTPNIELKLEIEQLSRSMMTMTLRCRVTLANRSDRAARDIAICADLVSANRQLPMDAQVAGATAFLPEIGSAERIGPHKTQSVSGTLTLPIQQLAAFKHSNRPMFVPLVRVRMDCAGSEPQFCTFVVGIAADPSLKSSSKLHPVPLDGIPGSYPNVRSRPIAIPDRA